MPREKWVAEVWSVKCRVQLAAAAIFGLAADEVGGDNP